MILVDPKFPIQYTVVTVKQQERDMLTAERLEQEFCDILDEAGPIVIAGISFDPSRVLREMDLIAYDVAVSDYKDSMGFDEE